MSILDIIVLALLVLFLVCVVLVLPILFLLETIRNESLGERRRMVWLVCEILFFPIPCYIYGLIHSHSWLRRLFALIVPAIFIIGALLPLLYGPERLETDAQATRIDTVIPHTQATPQ